MIKARFNTRNGAAQSINTERVGPQYRSQAQRNNFTKTLAQS